jgi:hypothetical protein
VDSQNKSNNNTGGQSPSSRKSVKIPASAWKILVILSCLATMVMYAETMLIPAIPDLIKDFHVSYSMSSWILTAYLITGAVMTPIAGKLLVVCHMSRITHDSPEIFSPYEERKSIQSLSELYASGVIKL